jgi:hypothetical protein
MCRLVVMFTPDTVLIAADFITKGSETETRRRREQVRLEFEDILNVDTLKRRAERDQAGYMRVKS